ncbi:hypothetical protein [Dysgonomonas sp. 25]|uniref:hypothetical protein n=1 Tax=Dysgonomonas sp. 25 TaxID=2302933 RepID=UPI0013D46B20|nr:hypothetical protein [Dysgonomonas sp. 25]NDV67925.1 hypothetical protein [Dysgonomonas sp. 25]
MKKVFILFVIFFIILTPTLFGQEIVGTKKDTTNIEEPKLDYALSRAKIILDGKDSDARSTFGADPEKIISTLTYTDPKMCVFYFGERYRTGIIVFETNKEYSEK